MDHIRRIYDRIYCHIKNTSKNFQDRPGRPAGSYKIDNIGDYPCEYNPKVHGPYNPARFYGTPDTPFSQLKLCEVTDWVKRRNKSPTSIAGLFSRAYWRWSHQYVQPQRSTAAPLIHSIAVKNKRYQKPSLMLKIEFFSIPKRNDRDKEKYENHCKTNVIIQNLKMCN